MWNWRTTGGARCREWSSGTGECERDAGTFTHCQPCPALCDQFVSFPQVAHLFLLKFFGKDTYSWKANKCCPTRCRNVPQYLLEHTASCVLRETREDQPSTRLKGMTILRSTPRNFQATNPRTFFFFSPTPFDRRESSDNPRRVVRGRQEGNA